MIKKEDISNFFNLEAEAAKKSWEALMKLPINDRIRKRKAIKDVFLDRGYREMSDENFVLLKVSMGVNLADFKEGEGLLLHKEGTSIGIKCALNSFIGDEGIILEVFPPKMPANLEDYFDVPLILDRDLVDLRDSVYYSFLSSLKDKPLSTAILSSTINPALWRVFSYLSPGFPSPAMINSTAPAGSASLSASIFANISKILITI